MKKILILLLLAVTLTGCTQVVKNKEGKPVPNPATNQTLTKNIICQPTNEEVKKLYDANKVSYKSLPECEKLTITSNSDDSLWTNVFIRPLATIIMKIAGIFNNVGWAVIVTGLLIRIIFLPITKKTASQSENMKKARPELDALDKKYANKKDQLPIFFAFYEAINRVPALFEGEFFGLNLGMTPLKGISTGNYIYLILVVLLAIVTYYSFNFSKQDILPGSNKNQNKAMMYFLLGFIVLASFNLSTAILLYWITSSGFTIFQNIYVARSGGKKNDK